MWQTATNCTTKRDKSVKARQSETNRDKPRQTETECTVYVSVNVPFCPVLSRFVSLCLGRQDKTVARQNTETKFAKIMTFRTFCRVSQVQYVENSTQVVLSCRVQYSFVQGKFHPKRYPAGDIMWLYSINSTHSRTGSRAFSPNSTVLN